jgi:hypothetical protein
VGDAVVTIYQECAIWAVLCLAPGNRINCYDPIQNRFITVEAYKRDSEWVFGDHELGIDIRTWGKATPYEQHCVRYRRDPLAPLQGYKRSEERYDAEGNSIDWADDY